MDSGKNKVIETIHTPSSAPVQQESIKSTVFTDLNVQTFASITDLDDGFQFILQHPYIVTQQYSDEVLAYAFELEMDGQTKKCYNTIRQALILQYCALLGKDGIGMFFKKIRSSDVKAKEMFMKDWNDTYDRIKNRVVEIHKETKEKERQEEEYLQKRLELATQPDGTYALPLPENPTEEETDRCQVFARLPQKLQKGLLIQDVDLINESLSELDPKIAGELMEDAGRVGLIDLQEEEDE
jgi:cell division cycle protein 37